MKALAFLVACFTLLACEDSGREPATSKGPRFDLSVVDERPVADEALSLADIAGSPAVLLPRLSGVDTLLASPNGRYLAGKRGESRRYMRGNTLVYGPQTMSLVHDLSRSETRTFVGALLGPPGDDGRICFEDDSTPGRILYSTGESLQLEPLEGRRYILHAAPGCDLFLANLGDEDFSSYRRKLWAVQPDGQVLWSRIIGTYDADSVAFSPSGARLALPFSGPSRAYVAANQKTYYTSTLGRIEVLDSRSGKTLRAIPMSRGATVNELVFVGETRLLVLETGNVQVADLDAETAPRSHRLGGTLSDFAMAGPGKLLVVDRAHTHGTSFSMPRLQCELKALSLDSGAIEAVLVDLEGDCPKRMVSAQGRVYIVTD